MYQSSPLFVNLLASEGLSVVFSAKADTASFNLMTRTVTLPEYKNGNKMVVDGMIVHEVGHAKYTPLSEELMKKYKHVNFSIINIVEDTRIERGMKAEYRGTGKMLHSMYDWLLKNNFFGIDGKILSELSFADRINLKYKLGPLANIPVLNPTEEAFIKEIDVLPTDGSVESYESVCEISERIQEYMLEQKSGETTTHSNDISEEGDNTEEGEDEGEGSSNSAPSTEQGEDSGEADGEGEGEADGEAEADGEGEGSEPGNQSNNAGEESGHAGDVSPTSGTLTDDDFLTQNSLDKSLKSLQTESNHRTEDVPPSYTYDELLEKNTGLAKATKYYKERGDISPHEAKELIDNHVIVSPQFLMKYFENYTKLGQNERLKTMMFENTDDFLDAQKYAKKVSMSLTTEFKMKAAASESRRTRIATSGVLNMGKLHEASYNDDIFLGKQIIDDGENHGAIVLIDLSGSMRGERLSQTIKKAYAMSLFCSMNNIPFKVLGYTSGDIIHDGIALGNENIYPWPGRRNMRLLEIANNTLNTKEVHKMFTALWNCFGRSAGYFGAINMGGTPLNDAIILLSETIKEFKMVNDVDKLSLTLMTDGQSHNELFYNISYQSMTYTGRSKKIYHFNTKLGTDGYIIPLAKTANATEVLKSEVPGLTVSYVFVAQSLRDFTEIVSKQDWSGYGGTRVWADERFATDAKKPWLKSYKNSIITWKNVGVFDSVILENIKPKDITTRAKNEFTVAATEMAQRNLTIKAGKIFARDVIDTIA